MMIYVEALLLACLFSLGLFSTYTDFKYGIVSNRMILWGFAVGTVLHIIMACCGNAQYYPNWLINMLIADLLSFGMYFCKLWAAGDSKLFMLLYYLFPPRLLDNGSLSFCIIPYIFIFVPALLWMIVDSFIRLIRGEPRKKQPLKIKQILINCIVVIIETSAFCCLFSILLPQFISEQTLLFSTIMLLYAYICSSFDCMKKWYAILIHAVIILIAYIWGAWKISLPPWENYGLILLIMGIQRFCSLYNYQWIKTDSVRKGMIPATETVIIFKTSKVHNLPQDPSEELSAMITEEEAFAIQRWGKTAKGKPNAWFVRKIPFAIMISLGFIIWSIIRLTRW